MNKIQKFQALLETCTTVYVVFDEDNVEAIWETKAAAELEVAGLNKRPRYYGRARIVPMKIRTEELAQFFYGPN